MIEHLLRSDSVIVDVWRGGELDTHPEERAIIDGAVEKRRLEFLRARTCARRALRRLGVEAERPLLPGNGRAPVWPKGVVGSITHTEGYCAAAVASADQFRGVGIDAEIVTRLESNLWPRIFTPEEAEEAAAMPSALARERAALLFSAKESFFKAQFPLTGAWLEFQDVRAFVEPERFRARGLPDAVARLGVLEGCYGFRDGLAFTALLIPATSGAADSVL